MRLRVFRFSLLCVAGLDAASTTHAGMFDFFGSHKDPNISGLTVTDAINARLWFRHQGKPYQALVAEQTRRLNERDCGVELVPAKQCSPADLRKMNSDAIDCVPALPNIEGRKDDDCIVISLDDSFLNDPAQMDALRSLVASPCSALANPEMLNRMYGYKYHYVYGMRYAAERSWNVLKCGSKNVATGKIPGRTARAC